MERFLSFDAASKARGMVVPYLRFLLRGGAEAPARTPDFRGFTQDGRDFAAYYQREIAPQLVPFEDLRQEKLQGLLTRAIVMVFAVGAVVMAAAYLCIQGLGSGKTTFRLLTYLPFVVIAVVGWATAPILLFRQDVKRHVFPRILAFFGSDFQYFPDEQENTARRVILPAPVHAIKRIGDFFYPASSPWGRDETAVEASVRLSDFVPSGLVGKHDESLEEDIVTGSHHGVRIAMLESRQYVRREKSDRLSFHGLFLRLSMNKHFRGHTLVRTDQGLLNLFQAKDGLQRVALEDPRFEKLFEVRGSDQVEARYLLTPSMMERLMELGSLFGQPRGIEAAFYANHLLLKIPLKTNRWFEGGDLFTPVTFEEDIRIIFSQMGLIFALIELLRLHEQTRL